MQNFCAGKACCPAAVEAAVPLVCLDTISKICARRVINTVRVEILESVDVFGNKVDKYLSRLWLASRRTMVPPIFTPAGPCLLWSGLLVGSSVAAVSKFRTPNVPRDVLLRVGREQFTALRRVEAGIAVAAVASVAASPASGSGPQVAVGVAVAAAACQGFVIVPLIRKAAAHAEAAGGKEKAGDTGLSSDATRRKAHMAQVVLELVKLGGCMYVSFMPV